MTSQINLRKKTNLRSLRLVPILFLLALIFTPLGASPARAVGCVVTTAVDSSVVGSGSLREKIADAACPTITFDNNYTILLSSQLTIDRDMTIDGKGQYHHGQRSEYGKRVLCKQWRDRHPEQPVAPGHWAVLYSWSSM